MLIQILLLGAPYHANGSYSNAGAVYVFFGKSTMPSATNASHTDNRTFGNESNMALGFSVSYSNLNNVNEIVYSATWIST